MQNAAIKNTEILLYQLNHWLEPPGIPLKFCNHPALPMGSHEPPHDGRITG